MWLTAEVLEKVIEECTSSTAERKLVMKLSGDKVFNKKIPFSARSHPEGEIQPSNGKGLFSWYVRVSQAV